MDTDSECSEDYDHDPFFQEVFVQKPAEEMQPELMYDDGQLVPVEPVQAPIEGLEEYNAMLAQMKEMEESLRKQGRQALVKFTHDPNEVSFIAYLTKKRIMAEKCKLKTEIEQYVRDCQRTTQGLVIPTDA